MDTLSGMVDKLSRELKNALGNIEKLTAINEQLLNNQTSITQKAMRWLMLFTWMHGEEHPDGSHRLLITPETLRIAPLLEMAREDSGDEGNGDIIFRARKLTPEEAVERLAEAKRKHLANLDKTFPKIIT